ncbi:Nucleotide exchange factor RasGEF P family protein, putative, partial [Entamoeba histolytica HM-3:IMSS]
SKKKESINPTPNNTKPVETKIEEPQGIVSTDKPNDTKVKEEIKKEGMPPARKKRPPPLKMVPAIRKSIDNSGTGTSSASGSTTNSSTGLLTQVEQKFKETGKLHLILDTMMFEKTNTEVVKVDEHSYENMRKTRRIYVNSDVHKEILMLLFNLIVMENGVLDPLYTDQFPDLKGMKDALFILSCHLDRSSNREIAKQLFCQESLNPGIQELLRLLSQQFFDMSKYSIIKVIGEGAYGVCSEALVKYGSDVTLNKVVIKQIKISESPKARSVLHDIFNEILILERHCRDERVSHLFEYGYNEGFYNIVMYQYSASLGSWRRNLQPSTSNTRIHLLLNIYKEVLRVCQVLNQRIIHFDIKCENFLIEPLPGVSLETVNNPQTEIPPFKLCLADFGEACVYRNDKEANTTRHRGTESIKPPEMLKMDLAGGMPVNASCDIWALGCLLYELYTSKMLFAIADVGEFYFRVLKSEELLTEENKELLGNNEYLIGFLEFVLNRDPTKRPQISTLAQRFDEVIEKFKKDNKKDLLKAKKWEKNRKMLERKQYEEIEEENIQSKKDIDIKRGIEVVDFEESKQVFKYFNNVLFGGEMNDEEVYKRGIKYVMHFGEELPTSLSLTAMNYPIPKTIEEMIKLFSRIIEVLREFVVSKRAVYICGDKGYMPAALLVGFTMQKHYLSEYESYLYIQKVCPYVRLHESVLSGLKYFEKNPIPSIFSGNDKLRHFHCLCGIVDIVLTQPIDEELVRNCRCEADGKECCPNRHNGCRIFLETMKEKSSYDAIFMKWVGVKQKNVVGMKNLLNVMNVFVYSFFCILFA